ncbi:MAG: acyltransferase [Lachnospiraceae bacterium]|nr:acyltransferase [Lachnospiraceae bacterium]
MMKPKHTDLSIAESIRSRNLQAVRLAAALGVLCTHAVALSRGDLTREWLVVLSRGQFTCGFFSVSIFFLISGFFGAAGALRNAGRKNGAGAFLKNRILRMWPALAVVTLLSMLLGLFFTSLSPGEYLTSPVTWKFLGNCLFVPVHDLPGVFTGQPYGQTVNGSLWTLTVEIACCLGCAFCLQVRFLTKRGFCISVLPAAAMFLFLAWWGKRNPLVWSAAFPCILCFYTGMAFWTFRDRIVMDLRIALCCVLVLAGMTLAGKGHIGAYLSLPYLVFYVGYGLPQVPPGIAACGERTYEIYLWGYPVQQAVVYMFGGGTMDPFVNFAVAVPIVAVLAYATGMMIRKR